MADSYLGESIKKLGFGLMRLPMIGEEIDMEQTKRMVDTSWRRVLPTLTRRTCTLGENPRWP